MINRERIYKAWLYCLDKCRYVFDDSQIKCFVALIFDITVLELNDIIRGFSRKG